MKRRTINTELNNIVDDYKMTQYKCITSPWVEKTISLKEVIRMISTRGAFTSEIERAREFGKQNEGYNIIKTKNLPTFRFNFLFKESASNENIIGPTGLIYIDVDDCDTLPMSKYIHVGWRSLSNTGLGLLVKVANLTVDNYKEIYNELAEEIGVSADVGARKATQQTVLSFDPQLFYNIDSTTYSYKEKKKVSSTNIKKEREGIVLNDTFCQPSSLKVIRFSDIDDFFKGEHSDCKYRFFEDDKAEVCNPFIPSIIKEGNRNSTMFVTLASFAALNPNTGAQFLKKCSLEVNSRCIPKLPESEIDKIIYNILNRKKEGRLYCYKNEKRRILFNPDKDFEKGEKNKLVGQLMGGLKRSHKQQLIYGFLEDWDFKVHGKIIQKKVSEISKVPMPTLKRYWAHFKDYVEALNKDYEDLCSK